MLRIPPRSTRLATRFPITTLLPSLVAEAVRELLFVRGGENRDLVHRADVGVQRADRAGHRQVVGDEGLIERGSCHGRHFSSVHMRLLTKGEVPSVPFMEQ